MAIEQKTSLWKAEVAYSGSIQTLDKEYLGSITIVKNRKDAASKAPDLKGFIEMKSGSFGGVVLWVNEKSRTDEKQPKLTGKTTIDGETLSISLWKQAAEDGKPTYTGKIQSARVSEGKTVTAAADDDSDF